MSSEKIITISISRTFGSGGGIVGSSIAKNLGLKYLDREIVMETAKKLGVAYENVQLYDEKNDTFWRKVLKSFQYGDFPVTPAEFIPSDEKVHIAESEIINNLACQESFVVVGRGANFLLNSHHNHVSIFVHADDAHRAKRIMAMYQLSEHDALKMIHKTDALREAYVREFTGHHLYDLRHYHLVLDSSKLSLEDCQSLIMAYLKDRFGESFVQHLKK